jgi:hypothetical protein
MMLIHIFIKVDKLKFNGLLQKKKMFASKTAWSHDSENCNSRLKVGENKKTKLS